MAARLRILARNIVDSASSIYTVPAFVSTLPASYMQRQTERARYAQTNLGVTAADIHLLYGSNQSVNMVAYTRTNFSGSTTVRNRLFGAGSPSPSLYDSTALAAMTMLSSLDTLIDVSTESDFQFLKSTVQYFPTQSTVQEIMSTVSDAGSPDVALRITRMFAGKYFETVYDPPFGGADLQIVDMSRGDRADDGSHIVDKKGKFRRLVLRLDFIPDTDLATMLAIARYLGTDKECFISLYPEWGGAKELYNMMACRLVDSPTFNPWQVGLHKNTMTFEET
jgi:hypothetical protein